MKVIQIIPAVMHMLPSQSDISPQGLTTVRKKNGRPSELQWLQSAYKLLQPMT
jgi:hypothetical protein